MSTKSFYTGYIAKTPSQTGFGCRKSVENPVENRVENRPVRHIRSQFGNAGLGVLTHQPSVCSRCGPRSLRHVTCLRHVTRRACRAASASLSLILGQDLGPALTGPEGLTCGV